MRRQMMAGNWKMNKTVAEAVELATALRRLLEAEPARLDVLIAPPFTALQAVGTAIKGSPIVLAGQNMHWEKDGAFTGEISPAMLRDVGCTFVILGHSERRHMFDETDERLSRKTRAAVDAGLVPLLCVGETLAERESHRTLEVIETQIERALRHLTPDEATRIVIAYEPVWAIGTGRAATPLQAQEVHAFIRKRVATSHGDAAAHPLRILYGGSVKPDNIGSLMAQGDVDGALVGGACLDAATFFKIIQFPHVVV
jgi:triosephosphate isomerase